MDASEILTGYERHMRGWGASHRTVTVRIRLTANLLDRWPDLAAVTTDDLSGWLAGDIERKAWTRATYFGHLRALFKWLMEAGAVTENPTDDLRAPQRPGNKPKPLTAEEERRALAAASGNAHTWLLLALRAGLRAHEIAKIRGEDVTEDDIYVRGKGDKEAFIPTHAHLWALAAIYPAAGWWFPSPTHDGHISGNSVTVLTGKLFRRVGITDGSIHRARHSYATSLLRKGVSIRVVQELMRHESLATTAAYCAVGEDERRAAIGLLGAA